MEITLEPGRRYWAILPAAGIGKRMQADIPKQYLTIAGSKILEHTLTQFLSCPWVAGVVVVLSAADERWKSLDVLENPRVYIAEGGNERYHSVLNGVQRLEDIAKSEDWVLVHDIARPCIRQDDLKTLVTQLSGHPVGGLLGVPVRDTMKRAATSLEVEKTVNRDGMWHAYTPQMFRLGVLQKALNSALAEGAEVTDEASALELLGLKPVMVEGHADNIKVTRPEDLALAEFFLKRQGRL